MANPRILQQQKLTASDSLICACKSETFKSLYSHALNLILGESFKSKKLGCALHEQRSV